MQLRCLRPYIMDKSASRQPDEDSDRLATTYRLEQAITESRRLRAQLAAWASGNRPYLDEYGRSTLSFRHDGTDD